MSIYVLIYSRVSLVFCLYVNGGRYKPMQVNVQSFIQLYRQLKQQSKPKIEWSSSVGQEVSLQSTSLVNKQTGVDTYQLTHLT